MLEPSLSLLSRLWLSEPDAELLRAAIEAGFPPTSIDDLALAYTDLFLLNVYPYGSVYLDSSGELNGAPAARAERLYALAAYSPPDLLRAAGADHAGLCIGFLAHAAEKGVDDSEMRRMLRAWIPVCTLAVEREPGAHEFYRFLARATREQLLSEPPPPETQEDFLGEFGLSPGADGEIRLSDVLRFLLTPARCGFFLSRGRIGQLARSAGLRIPFGSRFEVARSVFEQSGEEAIVSGLIDLLTRERDEWEQSLEELSKRHPTWAPQGRFWKARLEGTREALAAMRGIVESPPPWEYRDKEGEATGP
ncbi:MAG TPA: molecular chaperone TorD family protein [Thermoanaerobaculia bacterium]|nr:molecular chaperone TorD family protein [Thermoanaerobaculia bacterium]